MMVTMMIMLQSPRMDKFFIPLPNSDGRKASFRLSEADKQKITTALVGPFFIPKCFTFKIVERRKERTDSQ